MQTATGCRCCWRLQTGKSPRSEQPVNSATHSSMGIRTERGKRTAVTAKAAAAEHLQVCDAVRLREGTFVGAVCHQPALQLQPHICCAQHVLLQGFGNRGVEDTGTAKRGDCCAHHHAPLHPGSSLQARRAGPHTAGCRPRCCRRCLGRAPTCSAELKLQ